MPSQPARLSAMRLSVIARSPSIQPLLAAAVIIAGPHDFSASVCGTGAFTVNDVLGWSDLVAHQEDPGRIRAGIRQLRAQKSVLRAAAEAPTAQRYTR